MLFKAKLKLYVQGYLPRPSQAIQAKEIRYAAAARFETLFLPQCVSGTSRKGSTRDRWARHLETERRKTLGRG